MIGPAMVLAAIVALFHVSAYTFVRGRAEGRLPVLLVAAFLGAWAGDGVAGRLGVDPIRIGDFHVLGASVAAWIAIAIVTILAVLGPDRTATREPVPASKSAATTAMRPVAGRDSGTPT